MSTDDPEGPDVGSESAADEGQTSPASPEPSLVRPYAEIPARMVEAPAVLTGAVREVLDSPAAGADGSGADVGGRPRSRFAELGSWLAGATGRRLYTVPVVLAGAAAAVLLLTGVVLHQVGVWPFSPDSTAGSSVPQAGQPLPPPDDGTDASPSDRATEDKKDAEPSKSPEEKKNEVKRAEEPAAKPTPSYPNTPAPGGAGGGDQPGGTGCEATWQVGSQWEDFTATVRITNSSGQRINGWQVSWTWPGDQHLVKHWNAEIQESGKTVTARSVDTNAEIPTTGESSFGFEATGAGTPAPQLTCQVL